jgi:hypothetical protein
VSTSITSTPAWQKSSRSSDPDLAQCVEVAAIYEVNDATGA